MDISPSSLKRAKCLRRLVAEKLGGYKEAFGGAAAFGTKVHTVGEKWLKREADPNPATKEGRLFLEILPHVPSRDLDSERYLSIVCDGVSFHGYIDFGGWTQYELVTGDFKTSSRPWDYGLSTKELFLADEQVNIYSFANMIDYGADETHSYWLYADTSKSRYAYTMDHVITLSQTEDYLADHAIPLALNIISAFEAAGNLKEASEPVRLKVLNEIPCNPKECGYGQRNCGFTQHCELFEDTSLIHIPEGNEDMSDFKTIDQIIAESEARRAAAKGEVDVATAGEPVALAAKVDADLKNIVQRMEVLPLTPAAVEAATPVLTHVLPPEAPAALEAALEQRHLPPEQQDLGRKHAEKVAKEAEKAVVAETKAEKAAVKEAKKTVEEAKQALKDAFEAMGVKVDKITVVLK